MRLDARNTNRLRLVGGSGVTSMRSILAQGPEGPAGPAGADSTVPGPSNVLSIGTITKATDPAATITGTSPNQVLNLTLPAGDAGTAATVEVGTVTTGTAGSSASVTNSGTSSAAVLDFEIPQGAPGDVSSVNGVQPVDGDVTLTPDSIGAASQSALDLKADLVDGLVPSSQLPSYVDDVLSFANLAAFPATGEAAKIYIAEDTNLTYRWGGTTYGVLDPSLALGETASTAYRGDRGKTAYDHSQTIGNPHGTTAADVGALPDTTVIPDSPDDIGAASATQGGAEKVVQPTASTGSMTLDISAGSIFNTKTLTGNITLAPSNVPASGTSCAIRVIVNQGSTVRTVTMPSGTIWVGAPAPTQVASKICVIDMQTVDGGSTWIAGSGVQQ